MEGENRFLRCMEFQGLHFLILNRSRDCNQYKLNLFIFLILILS